MVRDQGIDAELRINGCLELAWAPEARRRVPGRGRGARRLRGARARRSRGTSSGAEIGTTAYHGGLAVDPGGVLHPAKWFVGAGGLAERAGADLHEGVRGRRRSGARPTGGSWSRRRAARSSRGTSSSPRTATRTASRRRVRRRIVPIGSYIIATEPLPEDLARELSPTGRAYFDTRNFLSYWHVSADRRLIFGGRVSFLPTTVDRTARLLFRRMLEIHPQLAGYRVEYSWGGKVAITMDRMPHIGRPAGSCTRWATPGPAS